jgi:hypothetical protein
LANEKISRLTIPEIILKGSILAMVITIPSIVAFVLSWIILDNLIQAVIVGAIIHFIAMGFSFKISKKLQVKK